MAYFVCLAQIISNMPLYISTQAMPVVVFMSSVIAVLYHLGAMQRLIQAIGWVLQVFMDTTAAESMAAAGNIFVGNVSS